MSIDLAQFHQVFFEESFEGLDTMETGLLNLDMGDVDVDEINTIFRAAHSIKGGSGTFGFAAVSDFTHVMETMLDEMRNGRRKVTKPAVDVLLGSVDCLREMLQAIQNAEDINQSSVSEHKKALENSLNNTDNSCIAPDPLVSSSTAVVYENLSSLKGWKIAFSPRTHLLKTGNDPVRIFRELATLGELNTYVDLQGVPDLYNLDPEDCHLSWKLTIEGAIETTTIDEIFAWVEDDCDIAKQAIYASSHETDLSTSIDIPLDHNSINSDTSPQHVTPTTEVIHKEDKEENKAAAKTSSSIRVDTSKIDTLINMVGELVITQSMLSLVGEHFESSKLDQLKNGLSQLERHTRELQESVMNIRMLPISFVFSRFPRMARDISNKLGKN
jgi:two-component system chemotaxis sensor kinase CheA